MLEGRDYDLTYSPTVSWPTVRLALAMVLIHKWHAKQVDYIQAYLQAPAARPMYMEIPKGCKIAGHNPKDWVLNVKRTFMAARTQAEYGIYTYGNAWKLLASKSPTTTNVSFQGQSHLCLLH